MDLYCAMMIEALDMEQAIGQVIDCADVKTSHKVTRKAKREKRIAARTSATKMSEETPEGHARKQGKAEQ